MKFRMGRRRFLQLAGGAAAGMICGGGWSSWLRSSREVAARAAPWRYPGPIVTLNQELIKRQGRWLG